MVKYAPLSVPFVEARNVGTYQTPTSIVLYISSTTSEKGAALGIANYHHSANAPLLSHHYIVDEAETYRCIPDNLAAYQSPHRSLSVLICAQPHEVVPLWDDATGHRVLYRTASLVADLILRHGIRPIYLDSDTEQRWMRHKWRRRGGLIVRVIGTWPYDSFLWDVKANVKAKGMKK
jgi:hypothetical protein